MFQYTAEEQQHLGNLLETITLYRVFDEQYDSAYYRVMAQQERENPSWRYPSHEGPHPSDMDYTSPEDLEEMADATECGAMLVGEELP